MDLKLLSCFGEHSANTNTNDNDTIEQLSFSQCDRFIASGDRGGNINIYRIKETGRARSPLNFLLATKFCAFKNDFDPFRNDMRNQKINCLQFLPKYSLNPFLLVSNRIFLYSNTQSMT